MFICLCIPSSSEDTVMKDEFAVTSQQSSPSKGGPGPTLTKSRIETLREEFGDSWLQSFNGVVPLAKATYTQSSSKQ